MPDETDTKKILTAAPWRTGGDPQDVLVLRGWRLSSRTWNPTTSPWMKQLIWRGWEWSTLETDVYICRYTLLVVHARRDDDDDDVVLRLK